MSLTPEARRHDLDLSIVASGYKPHRMLAHMQKIGNRPMSLRPEAMDLDLSVVGLWVSMNCLIGSHAESRLSGVYTLHCTLQNVLYSTLYSLLSSPVGSL
jgi:hypothetical protein